MSDSWHVITCEFPPRVGGVADFTRTIAAGLADRSPVHVWSPAPAASDHQAVVMHALGGGYELTALPALDRALEAHPGPRRLFVQWVPHGYGYKSLNAPFCLWVRRRVRRGDTLDLMVHEPFLPFDRRRLRQNAGALLHRGMLAALVRAARRVWVSTPAFIPIVQRFGGARQPRCAWLPVPSPVTPVYAPAGVADERRRLSPHGPIVGYFGKANPLVAPVLRACVAHLAQRRPDARIVLFGQDTDRFAQRVISEAPALGRVVVGLGEQPASRISMLIQCCDLLVQPYPDGATARRTTLTALLQHGAAVVTPAGARTEAFWYDGAPVALVRATGGEPLAAEAESLLASPEARRRLGVRARALYEARFDVCHALTALDAADVERRADSADRMSGSGFDRDVSAAEAGAGISAGHARARAATGCASRS